MSFDKVMNLEYPIPGWVYKTARSKALSRVYEKNAKPKYNHYEHVMATFDIRSHYGRVDWYERPSDKVQEIFDSWDFMSMEALKDELTAEASSMTRKERERTPKSMGTKLLSRGIGSPST